MNQAQPFPPLTQEQFGALNLNLGMMRVPHGMVRQNGGQQTLHASMVPGFLSQMNNALPLHSYNPGFSGLQLQTMRQMEAMQQWQVSQQMEAMQQFQVAQQPQLSMAGLSPGMAVAPPYALTHLPNSGALPSFSLQGWYPRTAPAPQGNPSPNTFSLDDDNLLAHVIHEDKGKKNLNESLCSLNGVRRFATIQTMTFLANDYLR